MGSWPPDLERPCHTSRVGIYVCGTLDGPRDIPESVASAAAACAAVFSAMEVVPLTLPTLDARDFMKLTRAKCEVCQKSIAIPHQWTFYFLMAVGFRNFVGAGIFGFLINLPIVIRRCIQTETAIQQDSAICSKSSLSMSDRP